jgi:heme-degrading monooxygenase HmoA
VIIQIIKFESALTEDEVLEIAQERFENFRALPGLLQKYYIKLDKPNHYGGVYIWDSKDSMESFRGSALAESIPAAYRVVGAPTIDTSEGLFQLRD